MKIAIVTGASSGLGKEFVRQISDKESLDEIWIIARRKEKLEELRDEVKTSLRILPMDLTDENSIQELSLLLKRINPEVNVLVCAAGMGRIGKVREIPQSDNDQMIKLNCQSLMDVTGCVLPYMHAGSRILEISSTAAFQPIADLGVYAASKAFVQSYTKALHYELLTSGIHVTAVCPYWIKDTEFMSLAHTTSSKGFRHPILTVKAKTVAGWALNDSRLNLWVSTPGPVCMLHRIAAKFIPHFIMVPLVDLIRHI